MAKKLAKAQLGRIVKKAVRAVSKTPPVPKSVGRTEGVTNYHPPKEWHGPAGRKSAAEDKAVRRLGTGLGLGIGAGAAASGALMAKKKGGQTKSKKK
jgi:hypothetical protein